MKQSAVEFLENNLPTAFKDLTINKQLIEQAKKIEKEQQGYSNEDILINIELAMTQGLTLGEYRDLLIKQFKNK